VSTWIIYADPEQDKVKDWATFEKRLVDSGLKISCDPKVKPRSKKAFVTVRDPKGIFDDPKKGDLRAALIGRRVRALISNWREATGHAQ
jgi:hypothetical protein